MEGVGNRLQERKMLLKLNNGALMKSCLIFNGGYFLTLPLDRGKRGHLLNEREMFEPESI